MSYPEKNQNGPPPAYEYQHPQAPAQQGMPVYTYPAEGPQQMVYAGQPVYPNQTGGYITQQPGQVTVLVSPALQNPPPDNMMYAIFVTICCCWPIGIFAIMRALAAREAINRGDRQSATEMSNSARCLSHAALGCGIGVFVLTIIIVVIYMAAVIPQMYG